MALTRANIEAILVRRCGGRLAAAGLDGTTVSGANADLSDPIRAALRQLGYSVASAASVADSDLASVAAADEEQLIDLAELRALESALGNLDTVDITAGPRQERLGQLADQLERLIARKTTFLRQRYGIGAATISAGAIGLGFQETSQ